MLWLIIVAVSFIMIFVSFGIYNKDRWDNDGWLEVGIIAIACTVIFGLVSLAIWVDERQFLAEYDQMVEYCNNYEFSSEIEQGLVNQKKYDFNTELREQKATAETMPIFCFYAERIKELDYIY